MKKYQLLSLVILAFMFAACSTNEPEEKQLIGIWTEKEDNNSMMKTLIFNNNGTVDYQDIPNPERDILPGWDGIFATLRFSVIDNKLVFSKENNNQEIIKSINFKYTTDFSIKGNILTIDSFSYDGEPGRFIKPLILYKK